MTDMKVPLFFLQAILQVVSAKGGCRELDFLDCKTDKALSGHVIKTIPVLAPGLEDCQHQCFIEDRCVSYNMGQTEGLKRLCNLSDTDHVEYPDDVSSVPGAEYCAIKNPCSSNPCGAGFFCKPNTDFSTLNCLGKNCAVLRKTARISESGVYNVTPVPGYTIQVYCDQVTDGGGWTVIQKRLDGSVNFSRGWDDYKRGFGNKNGEYWLGLDAIHILTKGAQNEIRFDLKDADLNPAYAAYESFRVGSDAEKYILQLGKFKKGDAGDSFSIHNESRFSTFDQDNDGDPTSCAQRFKGAWWYKSCHHSNLNAQYLPGPSTSYADGMNWLSWKGHRYSLKETEMKIRPVDYRP